MVNTKAGDSGIPKGIRDLRENGELYILLIPGLLLLLVFFYLPMLGVLIAFKSLRFHGNIFRSFFRSE